MDVFLHLCLCTTCMFCSWRPEEEVRASKTEVMDSDEPLTLELDTQI